MKINTTSIISISAFLSLSVQIASAESLPDAKNSQSIQHLLKETVAREEIPGMIAAISSSKGIESIASAGIRKVGFKDKISEDNLVHLGSCTKAMTSVLMANLVEEKVITWETKVIDVFPELISDIHPDYHSVTLWQLLTHRSGVPSNAKDWWVHRNLPLRERRLTILKENLKDKPTVKRGEFHYSNLAYMVAGCMAEKLTNSTWETLIQKRVFDPLEMTSAGFGAPGTPRMIDQPWGHQKSSGKWEARQFDNAEALGPAGRVHCTVKDWVKFISLQLPKGEERKVLLGQPLLEKLVTPVGQYGGGWFVVERPWGKGVVLNHNGSNTMWYASVWVAPLLDRAYIVITNSNDKNSAEICDKMIQKLIAIDQK